MSSQEKIQIISIGVAVLGWPINFLIGYLLGLRSQKAQRKAFNESAAKERRRQFSAFCTEWRSEIQQQAPSLTGWQTQDYCIAAFTRRYAVFVGETEKLRDDFKDQPKFNGLLERLEILKIKAGQQDYGSKEILEALDNLIRFVQIKAVL